jgi:hypothetical protein
MRKETRHAQSEQARCRNKLTSLVSANAKRSTYNYSNHLAGCRRPTMSLVLQRVLSKAW